MVYYFYWNPYKFLCKTCFTEISITLFFLKIHTSFLAYSLLRNRARRMCKGISPSFFRYEVIFWIIVRVAFFLGHPVYTLYNDVFKHIFFFKGGSLKISTPKKGDLWKFWEKKWGSLKKKSGAGVYLNCEHSLIYAFIQLLCSLFIFAIEDFVFMSLFCYLYKLRQARD